MLDFDLLFLWLAGRKAKLKWRCRKNDKDASQNSDSLNLQALELGTGSPYFDEKQANLLESAETFLV